MELTCCKLASHESLERILQGFVMKMVASAVAYSMGVRQEVLETGERGVANAARLFYINTSCAIASSAVRIREACQHNGHRASAVGSASCRCVQSVGDGQAARYGAAKEQFKDPQMGISLHEK